MSGTPSDNSAAGDETWVRVQPSKERGAAAEADSGSDGSWEVAGGDGQAQAVALSSGSEAAKPSSQDLPATGSEGDRGAPECDDLWILLAEGDQSGGLGEVPAEVRERWAARVAQRAARAAQLAAPRSKAAASSEQHAGNQPEVEEKAAAEAEAEEGSSQAAASTGPRQWAKKPEAAASAEPRPWAKLPEAGGGTEPRPWAKKPEAAGGAGQRPWAKKPEVADKSQDHAVDSKGLDLEANVEATLGRLRRPMDAYAHMVYFKIQTLLEQSYNTPYSLDAEKMKGLALEQYRQLLHDSVWEKRQRARKLEFSEQEKQRAEAQIARYLQLDSPDEIATAPLESLTTLTPGPKEEDEEEPAAEGADSAEEEEPAPDTAEPAEAREAHPDDLTGIMNVWDHLDKFAYVETDDSDGKVLVPSIAPSAPPSVASKEEFLARFHRRTGGIFQSFDWSNLRIIGGLMPACLIADDEAFATDAFAETDVDVYVVGLTGSAFKERVASAISGLYASARSCGLRAVVVKTPCTISISLRGPRGPLPNVQIVTSPFTTTHHLLSTTDIDITGFGFDGENLFATSTACEAVRHRRNVARPEKYNIRGEFSTESRLLKYAMRGFRVVDTGLPPDLEVPGHEGLEAIAAKAAGALLEKAVHGTGDLSLDHTYNQHERAARASGVTGAHLLLLAQRYPGLQQLLLYDVPPMPAGMADARLLALLRGCDATDGYEHMLGDGQKTRKPRKAMLKLLFPSRLAVTASEALKDVRERDPDARRTVRSWYTGLEEHIKEAPEAAAEEK